MSTMPELPPASESRGVPGHNAALDRIRGTAMIEDYAFGLTYEQLAEKHGYSDRGSARGALLRALDRHEAEAARHLRVVENARYELDQRVLRAVIADRDKPTLERIRAIEARTRSSARNARLNGLDAPQQLVVSSGAVAQVTDALAALEELVLGEDGVYAAEPDNPAEDDGSPSDPPATGDADPGN